MKYDFDLEDHSKKRKEIFLRVLLCALEIGVVLFVAYAITHFGLEKMTVSGKYMSPTLKDGDEILINKMCYRLHKVRRNDVVVVKHNGAQMCIRDRIGNGLTRPMVGMHFFNPADRMKLIEVIAGVNTPAETVETIKKISENIGKTPVQVNEAAGFVVNRILIPMINEAAFIKMEGVSDIAGIDAAMKLGANHPMGPLELGDFVGLDICLAIMDVLYNETGDSKYRACPLLRKMVRGGNPVSYTHLMPPIPSCRQAPSGISSTIYFATASSTSVAGAAAPIASIAGLEPSTIMVT